MYSGNNASLPRFTFEKSKFSKVVSNSILEDFSRFFTRVNNLDGLGCALFNKKESIPFISLVNHCLPFLIPLDLQGVSHLTLFI